MSGFSTLMIVQGAIAVAVAIRRGWLARHHGSESEVWLVFYKQHTGVASIPYKDALDEALCFGWIDSLIKRLDDNRYALKVTPRKPTSKWSEINRKRWAELNAAGLLSAAGVRHVQRAGHVVGAARVQTGRVQNYALGIALGLIAMAGSYFLILGR